MPSKKSNKTATKRRSSSSVKKTKKKSTVSKKTTTRSFDHVAFFPILFATLIFWVLYRSIFNFPVWFDETIGKAIFFGLPVWLYVSISGMRSIPDTFDFYKIKRGLLIGIAVGGLYGFIASILAIIQKGGQVEAASIFMADAFWQEFALAIFTGFWETLFFYSFIMTVIQDKYKSWPLLNQILLVALIFVLFHIPNTILRFGGIAVMQQIFILTLFAIGQGYLFASEKNGYALTISQAIWGMVLLVHF